MVSGVLASMCNPSNTSWQIGHDASEGVVASDFVESESGSRKLACTHGRVETAHADQVTSGALPALVGTDISGIRRSRQVACGSGIGRRGAVGS